MDGQTPRVVRNESFDLNLKHGLCSSFTEQEFCDMTFAVGNHLYNAHKIVLSISSVYLKNILLASPAKYPIVVLSDVRPKILEYLLQFMYCGSVEVPAGDLNDFLSSGKNLHIKGLQAINSEHLSSVSKDNKIISNENDNESKSSSSTLTFCPDSIKSFTTQSNIKRKPKDLTLSPTPTKKLKKRHSVSFKIDPDFTKDNDEEFYQYDNIMEPEVRIQDDFIRDDKQSVSESTTPSGPNISNHAGKVENADIKFVKGVSGKLHLLCNNYTFHKNTMRKDRVYWLCAAYQSQLQCRARCVTINGKVMSITGYHNHETDYKERLTTSADSILLDGTSIADHQSCVSGSTVATKPLRKLSFVNNTKNADNQSTTQDNIELLPSKKHTDSPPGTSSSVIDDTNDTVKDSISEAVSNTVPKIKTESADEHLVEHLSPQLKPESIESDLSSIENDAIAIDNSFSLHSASNTGPDSNLSPVKHES